MNRLIKVCVFVCALALAACGGGNGPISTEVSGMRLADVSVRFGSEIGRTATGEEFASNFLWAGTGEGNRKRQVVDLFRDAANDVAVKALSGSRPVNLEIEVTQFHGIPEWARLVCCGYHSIRANLALRDPGTGQVIAQAQDVSMGRVGLGGVPKAVAELAGRSERDLVRASIADGIRGFLAAI